MKFALMLWVLSSAYSICTGCVVWIAVNFFLMAITFTASSFAERRISDARKRNIDTLHEVIDCKSETIKKAHELIGEMLDEKAEENKRRLKDFLGNTKK